MAQCSINVISHFIHYWDIEKYPTASSNTAKILSIWLWSHSTARFCLSFKQLKDTQWSVTGTDFPVCIFAFERSACARKPKRGFSTVGAYDSPVQYITHSAFFHSTLILPCGARASLCVDKWWGQNGLWWKSTSKLSLTYISDFSQCEGGSLGGVDKWRAWAEY